MLKIYTFEYQKDGGGKEKSAISEGFFDRFLRYSQIQREIRPNFDPHNIFLNPYHPRSDPKTNTVDVAAFS